MFHPDSKWKMRWDLLVIILAIYNSVMSPYELAYGTISSVYKAIVDWTCNVLFFTDIIFSFWTMVKNPKTEEIVNNWKYSAIRYVFYGRFIIDLAASFPTEILNYSLGNNPHYKLVGLLKLIRILRLGWMITFLWANQKLKFSLKIFQLVFILCLFIHFWNCGWYYVV